MSDAVPFYLMPIAAILGLYVVMGLGRIVYLIYSHYNADEKQAALRPSSVQKELLNTNFYLLVGSVIAAGFGYAKIVAIVNQAVLSSEYALFDPFDILGVSENDELSAIKDAYRNLSKIHHPDKGGSASQFNLIHLAYQALTDETAKLNYEQYGHPNGPVARPSLELALPDWLLHPTGNVAIAILLIYFVFLGSVIYIAATAFLKKEPEPEPDIGSSNTVGLDDIAYLATKLSPESTQLDILLCVASTPENIAWGTKMYENAEKLREERRQKDAQEAKKPSTKSLSSASSAFDLSDDGWDDGNEDDNEDEAAKRKAELAAKAEAEKLRDREQLKKATGQVKVLLEGFDEGVIGQKWVEKTLQSKGAWPPKDLGILKGETFEYNKKVVEPLDHPGLRRNLCMIMGRLNSQTLNAHPELLEAGSKQLVDQTYFKASMEFRGRCGILLEGALRTAVAVKSFRLAKTIVEAVAMFKIGCYSHQTEWFQSVMDKTYQFRPKLQVENPTLETPDEPEMATGDVLSLQMELTRLHAEAFTRQKIAMFQKQGIPPQVALQTYREAWWFLLTAKRIGGDDSVELPARLDLSGVTKGILQKVDPKIIDQFEREPFENHLVTAWPMIVQNVAQKTGKVKIQFKAPAVPGKYKFTLSVKSQDFLACDHELSLDADIVDASTVERKEKEAEEDKEKATEESKKEK